MIRPRLTALLPILVLAACRIEDRTPSGTRQDQTTIQALVNEYARALSDRSWPVVRSLFWPDAVYAGAPAPGLAAATVRPVPVDSALRALALRLDGVDADAFDVRVVRVDLRQEGDVAAAWVTTRRRTPEDPAAERDWMEHFVFTRFDGEWRILSVAHPSTPRRRPRSGTDLVEASPR